MNRRGSCEHRKLVVSARENGAQPEVLRRGVIGQGGTLRSKTLEKPTGGTQVKGGGGGEGEGAKCSCQHAGQETELPDLNQSL